MANLIMAKTDEWEYYLSSDGKIALTRYFKRASEVEIPDEIDGYPVAFLKARLLKGRKSPKSVVLPKTLEFIGYEAFCGCTSLRKLSFEKINLALFRPNNKYTNYHTFYGVPAEEVILPPEIQKAVDNGKKLNEKQTAFVKMLESNGLKSYSVLMALAATV